MENDLFKRVQQYKELPLSEKVAQQITDLIKTSNISVGEKLPNEFELAESLNVGRGSIREAVKILVARGILEIRRGKGTYVSSETGTIKDPFGFESITDINEKIRLAEELFELRNIAEPEIAALAARRITDDEKKELLRRCDEVERIIREGSPHFEADLAMHKYIGECTHNSVLSEITPTITYSVQLFTSFRQQDMLDNTILTHRKFVECICAHDESGARDAMREHIHSNLKSIQLMRDWAEEHRSPSSSNN